MSYVPGRDDNCRAELIDKELTVGLDESEKAELQLLQAGADRYLEERHPIALEDLSWLEKRVRELKGDDT